MSALGLELVRRPPWPWRAGRRAGGAAWRAVCLVASSVLLLTAMSGWLYWARIRATGWPGPRVAALPLDALPGHSTVPLVVYAPLLAAAALAGGLVARLTATGRLLAALALGAGAGGWTFLHEAAAAYVVRQVSLGEAMSVARGAPPEYIAAVAFALAGALLGRSRRPRRLTTALAALGTALAGMGGLIAAVTGARSWTALAPRITPSMALSRPLALPVGLLLLVSSWGLAHRSRAAWWSAAVVLACGALAHLVLTTGNLLATVAVAALSVLLVAERSHYAAPVDPAARPAVLGRSAAALAGTASTVVVVVLAAGSLLGVRHLADVVGLHGTFAGAPPAVLSTGRHLGLALGWSLAGELAIAVLAVAVPLVSPWRPRFDRPDPAERAADLLVRQHGHDSLAPFTLRPDKALFFAPAHRPPSEQALVAYRVVRGVAVVSGAPVGPPSARLEAVRAFSEFCHRRGWTVAVVGVVAGDLSGFASLGFKSLYHGVEGVIDVAGFSLAGGRMKAVRQAVGRLERQGYRAEVVYAGDADADVRREILEVERSFLGEEPRTGFVMELDDLFRLGQRDAVFVLGRDPQGRLAGLLHLAACPPSRTLSLSSMPRLAGVPNGFTSFLVVRAVDWCAEHGIANLSLNFSPLAPARPPTAAAGVRQRLRQAVIDQLKAGLSLQLDNLYRFNSQFCPGFQARYLVLERWTDLPRVLVAAMAAEGYLPFAERLRGWRAGEAEPAAALASPGGRAGRTASPT